MLRHCRIAMASGLLIALAACVPAPPPDAPAAGSGDTSAPQSRTLATPGSVAPALNAYRASGGLTPLTAHPALMRAAQDQAAYLAATGRTGHTGRGGSSVMDRVRAQGLQACLVAENLSFGYPTAAQAVAGWKGSAGHNRNMLLPNASLYGEGHAGAVRVLVLARPC
ncbi:CAP domain-containing protein [Oceanicola sp. D3]|uniref:CAP domain-containing protein n=1 Tax=Oceanicola sp. D3 TaxID=2587163 RepID=UPI00111E6DA3|nr:CAP domain-containing protein [Oceanicola sp. D3]QDC10507.1 CAP domain-containing protein [Oceanicola sp. D3]